MFSETSRPDLRSTQTPVYWVPGLFSGKENDQDLEADDSHLMPRLGMSTAIRQSPSMLLWQWCRGFCLFLQHRAVGNIVDGNVGETRVVWRNVTFVVRWFSTSGNPEFIILSCRKFRLKVAQRSLRLRLFLISGVSV
jgi:hypothetical protein